MKRDGLIDEGAVFLNEKKKKLKYMRNISCHIVLDLSINDSVKS